MMEAVSVRLATADDVGAISRVLIASITELCGADHLNDPDRISAWLSNKTPDAVRAMFASPDSTFYIAERGPEMAGVGCLDSSGISGSTTSHRAIASAVSARRCLAQWKRSWSSTGMWSVI